MRILLVGTSKTHGGTETHFITMANALSKTGHDVAAIVKPGSPIKAALQNSNVKLYDGVFRNSIDPRGFRAVRRAIREFKPDWLVGSFSKEYWPLVYISRRTGVPLAIFRHMAMKMKRGTQYFIPRLAHRFIVISSYMKELFVNRGVPEELLKVIHNSLDTDYYKPDAVARAEKRQELNIGNKEILVGYVGAMHPGKGIFTLFDAAEEVLSIAPEYRFLWIGPSVPAGELGPRVKSATDSNKHFLMGYIFDVRPWLAAMDILVLPSLEPDTFGRVLIEAQASGIAVIGSNIGGIPEAFLPDYTGKMFEPGNARDCAEKLLELRDPRLRKQFGEKGRQFVINNFAKRDRRKVCGNARDWLNMNDISLYTHILILSLNYASDTRRPRSPI